MNYLTQKLPDLTNVKGVIYKITNIATDKIYIGRTRTHHRYGNKRTKKVIYRPFGHIARFREHCTTAIANKRKRQCFALNNAIREYGVDKFKCELIMYCDLKDTDKYEIAKIKEYNTLFPNGYNLDNGGKSSKDIVSKDRIVSPVTDEVKRKLSVASKKIWSTPEGRKFLSEISNKHWQELGDEVYDRHDESRLKKFKDAGVSLSNTSDPKEYIKAKYEKGKLRVYRVKIGPIFTDFYVNKVDPVKIYQRATDFVNKFIKGKNREDELVKKVKPYEIGQLTFKKKIKKKVLNLKLKISKKILDLKFKKTKKFLNLTFKNTNEMGNQQQSFL